MAQQLFADAAQAQLSANVTTTPTVGTPEVWSISSPINLPSPATGQQFYASVQPPGGDTNPEIVIVTGRTSTTMNVLRGEGSNGVIKTHTAGDIAKLIVAAPQIQPIFTGTLASINYSTGAATVTIPSGTVSASIPSTVVSDPSMAVGVTVAVVLIAGVYTILGAQYVRAKPSGRMFQNSSQLAPNTADTDITGMTTDWLTGGVTFSNNSLVVPIAGKYLVSAAAGIVSGSFAQACAINILVNNSVVRAGGAVESGGIIGGGTSEDLLALNASDVVGLQVFQNTGGSKFTVNNATATYVSVGWQSWI